MPTERLRFRDIRSISTFRLTMRLGLIFMIGVAALLGLIYVQTAQELNARSDSILRRSAAQLDRVRPADLPDRIRLAIAQSSSRLNYYTLESADGRLVLGNVAVPPGLRFDRPVDITEAPGLPGPVRMLATRTPSGATLVIGRDIAPVVDLRRRMLMILLSSGLLIALAVLGSAVMASLAPLRRVRALQQVSRRIAAGDLNARMPVLGRHDELDQFADTVNVMVEDVGRVLLQVKEVTDVIAHDLRTPLARVRRQLDRLLQEPDLAVAAGRHIEGSAADLDLVLDRFTALLRISELEDGRRRSGFSGMLLHPMLAAVHDLYEPLAEQAGVGLACACPADLAVTGDEQLLFEAISNLVDNAVKFSPPGGRVTLAARAEEGVVIEIRDEGSGIAGHERDAVLRRFYRGANAAGIPGSGVGLGIVMAIVRLHHFVFELDDAKPGLIARIRCKT